jgi:hypothetical protein
VTANVDGVVTEADVRAAQTLVDLLLPVGGRIPLIRREDAAEARGLLAAWSADVRTAGYLEGVQRGRQEAAHVVLDALKGEGLAP